MVYQDSVFYGVYIGKLHRFIMFLLLGIYLSVWNHKSR